MPKAQESAQREQAACFARRRTRCKPSPAISMPRPSPKLKLLPCATIGDESSECGEALALLGSHTFVEGEGTVHTSRSSPTQPVAPIEGCSDSLEGDVCLGGDASSTWMGHHMELDEAAEPPPQISSLVAALPLRSRSCSHGAPLARYRARAWLPSRRLRMVYR